MPPIKRKGELVEQRPVMNMQQPSWHDASGEEAENPFLEEIGSFKRRNSDSAHSASKRPRVSRSDEASQEREERAQNSDNIKAARRIGRIATSEAQRTEKGKGTEDVSDGERESPITKKPLRAGLVDPVGYQTNPPPEGRPVRVYADGVFDLFHLGHMRQLEQAKNAFPDTRLIVGVTGDSETHKRKGLTVLSGKDRAETVRHCKWVDEVIEDCPWIVTPEFMEKHNIDYVAHDDLPYGADEGDDIYGPIKQRGQFLVTQRTEGVSTTGIISKIVRDYDQYIARQLKRGTSRQELNISWLKKNELDLKRHMAELRNAIRNNWTSTGQELGRELRQFWQSSQPASPAGQHQDSARRNGANRGPSESSNATKEFEHLDPPKSPMSELSRTNNERSNDFAAGYNLGIIGGVVSWMTRSRRTLGDSQQPSPRNSSDEESNRGESIPPRRGRQSGRSFEQDELDAQVVDELGSRS